MNKIMGDIKSEWPLAIIVLEVIVTATLYPILPKEIAIHWNSQTADGFLPKYIGAFIIPVVTLVPYFLRKRYDVTMISARFRITAVIILLIGCQVFVLFYALSLR